MKPYIVVLRGVHDCGKTTTIKMALEMLRKHDSRFKTFSRRGSNEVGGTLRIGRVNVGLFSAGDLEEILARWFRLLDMCDVIVCACRSRGKTEDFIKIKRQDGCKVKWIEKERVWEEVQQQENKRKAEELVGAINHAVKHIETERRSAREMAKV